MKFSFERVPIWVRLYNIPTEFWTVEGVGCVASVIGVPIQSDTPPEDAPKLSYAQVCVEVNVHDKLPDTIDLEVDEHRVVVIRVEYAWRPE